MICIANLDSGFFTGSNRLSRLMSSKKRTEVEANYPLSQRLLFASAKGNLCEVIELLQRGATVAVNKVSLLIRPWLVHLFSLVKTDSRTPH